MTFANYYHRKLLTKTEGGGKGEPRFPPRLPQQLICQPSFGPLDMTVPLMSLFIQFATGVGKCYSPLSDKCRVIVHSECAHTGNLFAIPEHINLLVWVFRWFDKNIYFPPLFSCVVCYTICHYHITRNKSGNLRFPEPLPLYPQSREGFGEP